MGRAQRGQSTVEWVGILLAVSLLLAGLLAAGVRLPGTALAQALTSRILCAAALANSCGDEPALIAAYGTEVGKLVRGHMPTIVFEEGSRAVPVDFRRCRESACGDSSEDRLVRRSDPGLPVTAFVHVVDCREAEAERTEAAGADCSGERAGHLYLQYWLYYVDSATLRGVPVVGEKGFHEDDWEGVQVRIGSDGRSDQRASSHHGYNYRGGAANWGSDAGIGPLNGAAEALGLRDSDGWGPETGLLVVSGGSHAGHVGAELDSARFTPADRVRLIPLEPIAAGTTASFAVSPPWQKKVWVDPEAKGTS